MPGASSQLSPILNMMSGEFGGMEAASQLVLAWQIKVFIPVRQDSAGLPGPPAHL